MKTSKRLKSQVCIALLGAGCLIGSTAYANELATESSSGYTAGPDTSVELAISASVESVAEVAVFDFVREAESFTSQELLDNEIRLGTADMCLHSNDTTENITVTATSSNTGVMKNLSNDEIDYILKVQGQVLDMGQPTVLAASTYSCYDQIGQDGLGQTSDLVEIFSPAGEHIIAGDYSDTIFFSVEPGGV